LPDDYIRSRHLTAAVDTFCYGIFLFELVTGKPPSWQPPGAGMRMRDIMLDSSNPGEWIDKSPNEVTPWANCLFFLGRDCAKHSRKRRPEMKHVLFALEELQKSPSSLALQGYYDVKNSRVTFEVHLKK
jgi:serine/threonine protein kinase